MALIYISHEFGGREDNREDTEGIIRDLMGAYPQHTFVSPIHCFGFAYQDVDYDDGMRYCLDLLDRCDEMWVFGDLSEGVRREISYCEQFLIPYTKYG